MLKSEIYDFSRFTVNVSLLEQILAAYGSFWVFFIKAKLLKKKKKVWI